MGDHALGKQRVERFNRGRGQMATNLHGARKEARIEQVQNRMFYAADILIDVHPITGFSHIRRCGGIGGREARVIPRGIHESIHCVGLAAGLLAASGAGTVAPGRMAIQWVPRNVKCHIVGQADRQVFFFFWHYAAAVTMHHWNRTAPITLSTQAPIAQTILRFADAKPLRLCPVDCGINRFLPGRLLQAGRLVDPAHCFGFGRHKGHIRYGCGVAQRKECINHRQIIFPRKIKVALVMGGAGEDRASAIVHHHEIGDPNRQWRATKRVLHGYAGIKALLFRLFHGRFCGVHFLTFSAEVRQRGILSRQALGQRMVGGEADE